MVLTAWVASPGPSTRHTPLGAGVSVHPLPPPETSIHLYQDLVFALKFRLVGVQGGLLANPAFPRGLGPTALPLVIPNIPRLHNSARM